MRIHAIQTGSVAIKERQRHGVGQGTRRQLNTVMDKTWTEPLPIYAWVIVHPEGIIVVDTGETARVAEPGYFPWWHPYFRLGVRSWVRPEEEIGPQLQALGIQPADIRWLVMTHLHTDHAGGLHHFPKVEIFLFHGQNTRWHRLWRDVYVVTFPIIGQRGSHRIRSTLHLSPLARFHPVIH